MKRVIPLAILTAIICAGCGNPGDMTTEQQEADMNRKIAFIDKAMAIAAEHGYGFSAKLRSSGKPGVGEDLKFYLDTGVSLDLQFFGISKDGTDEE